MSQIDTDKDVLSEDTDGYSDGDNLKLVPVAESIRYRKRAQSAEKRNEILAEQLNQAESKAKKVAEQLSEVQFEQSLTHKLATAGVVDMETAVLIAKTRMEDSNEAGLDGVIEPKERLGPRTGKRAIRQFSRGQQRQHQRRVIEQICKSI